MRKRKKSDWPKFIDELTTGDRWELKQALADGRFYGDGGTIHSTGHLDVETHEGRVTSVWFRCQMLPFNQIEVDEDRAYLSGVDLPAIKGVEVAE